MELRGVQTTEMHQQPMNQLGERLSRLESQPHSISQLPVSGSSAPNPLKEEHGKRIQELQIWVQALNGGTSALVDPRNWQNPLLGVQAEQKAQRNQWEELNQLYNTIRNQYQGLLKDLGKQQEKVDRIPIQALEAKYHKLESRIEEIQRLGTHPIPGKKPPVDCTQSSPLQLNLVRLNRIQFDRMGLNPIQRHPFLLIRMPLSWTSIQLVAVVQCQPNPIQRHWMGRRSIHHLELRPRRLTI